MKMFSLIVAIFAFGACIDAPKGDEEIVVINFIPDNNDKAGNNDVVISDMGFDSDSEDMDDSVDVGEDQGADVDPGPQEDIAVELAKLPNVENVEELGSRGGVRRFYVDFRLPLDHFSEDGPVFSQRGILYFRDYDAPTVLMTTGYGLPDIRNIENLPIGATDILNANQFVLGHRFFTGALPAPQDQNWDHVNIQQSAADTHEILRSMRSVLRESWIGTGWSKGGMTIIFQEYFYPDDLDLAIPMVAPISFGLSDKRYPPFLADIGTQECRARLEESMIGALERRLELADVFNPRSGNERQQYAYQIRFSVMAFTWAFWQYYGLAGCNRIPSPEGSARDLVSFFVYNRLPKVEHGRNEPRPITAEEAPLIAYNYQGLHQLGFQDSYPTGLLQKFVDLGYLGQREKAQLENPNYAFGDYPWSSIPEFDPQPMIDIDAWLKEEAQDIIAIYGEFDPWTAGKVTLNAANDSQVYIAPGASHGAFLSDLNGADYNAVRERILSFDRRERALSFTGKSEPQKATQAERETLIKLLRQEL